MIIKKILFFSLSLFCISTILLLLEQSLSIISNLHAACTASVAISAVNPRCFDALNPLDNRLTDGISAVVTKVSAGNIKARMLADVIKRDAFKAAYKGQYGIISRAWNRIMGRGLQTQYEEQVDKDVAKEMAKLNKEMIAKSNKILDAFPKQVLCNGISTVIDNIIAQSAILKANIPANKTCAQIDVKIQTIAGEQTVKYVQHKNGDGYLVTGPQLGQGGQKTAQRAVKILPLDKIGPHVYLTPNTLNDAPDLRIEGDLSMAYKADAQGDETLALNDNVCEDNSPPPKAESLTMTLFPGGDGKKHAQANIMTTDQAIDESKRLMTGLQILQKTGGRFGSAHCDIKLENMFVDGDGHYHLADFGFLTNVNPGVNGRNACRGGTAGYIPPEGMISFFGGTVPEPRSVKKGDVFALAASIYEMRFKVSSPIQIAAGEIFDDLQMQPAGNKEARAIELMPYIMNKYIDEYARIDSEERAHTITDKDAKFQRLLIDMMNPDVAARPQLGEAIMRMRAI
ncbi:MAG: hypothetical protein HQK53_18170 [Oligoflexia bacterium]|nr:hypothetical protein [Oligoflexia bacterium]